MPKSLLRPLRIRIVRGVGAKPRFWAARINDIAAIVDLAREKDFLSLVRREQ
jgi:hypothetical protein